VPRPLELISIVVPVFNEEAVVPLLLPRVRALLEQLPAKAEVIFVDDGSRDRTGELLAAAAAEDMRIKVLEFSRNFGHQIAITAGTDFASGDVVVIMDADLQDPPEVVLEMIRKYQDGYDAVYGRRTVRHGESWFKRATARCFYWIMRKAVHQELPDNAGDFRLVSRQVADAFRQLRERHRFVRGMVTWLGFQQTAVDFERPARAAGETKYPLRKMLGFAWRAVTSFSGLPLRIGLAVGVLMMLAAFVYAGYAVFVALVMRDAVPGWASLVCLLVGLSGMIITMLGLIGDYVARIYEELKARPLYIVRSMRNLDVAAYAGAQAVVPSASTLPIAPHVGCNGEATAVRTAVAGSNAAPDNSSTNACA
jgi:dolichol-phosphate mannosyltransferase